MAPPIKVSSAMLKEAFILAAKKEFSDVPSEQSLNHTFSPEFVARIEKLKNEIIN